MTKLTEQEEAALIDGVAKLLPLGAEFILLTTLETSSEVLLLTKGIKVSCIPAVLHEAGSSLSQHLKDEEE